MITNKIKKKAFIMIFHSHRYVPFVPKQLLDHLDLLVLVEVVGDEASRSPNVKMHVKL